MKPRIDRNGRDWTPTILEREGLWAKMKAELESAGIARRPIWPSGETDAALYVYPAAEKGAPRGTVIVLAGGAFMFKSPNEAKPVAEFFRAAGLNAAILDYSVDRDNPDSAVESPEIREKAGRDALQAVRYLRANADSLRLCADKIAVAGFSAGGIACQTAATAFDYGIADAPSSRPDAVLLLYGAFSNTTSINRSGYDIAAQNELARRDPLRSISADCPPVFIFQTHEDDPRNALVFAMALADRGIPHEVHAFARGHHGGALYDGNDEHSPGIPHTSRWANLAAEWLKGLGF